MNAQQLWAGQATWAAKNSAYNLDFIPDDKLDWKPAPEANSALEIAHHMAGVFTHFTAMLQKAKSGGDNSHADSSAAPEESKTPATREEAKEQLMAAAQTYLDFLQTVQEDDMQKPVASPMGTMPFWFMAGLPVSDAIHHHGQIAYIQTLLGDTESHFDMSLMPQS